MNIIIINNIIVICYYYMNNIINNEQYYYMNIIVLKRAGCSGWVGRVSKRKDRYINSGVRKAG